MMKLFSVRRLFLFLAILALAGVLCAAGAQAAIPPPKVLWTAQGGAESLAKAVAVQGSKTYVAAEVVENGKWYGVVLVLDALGHNAWESDHFDLQEGEIRAIAVSGSRIYVAGYYRPNGVAADELFFLQAYNLKSQLAPHRRQGVGEPGGGLF
jgi:opacity protein-like surface antigen